MEAIVLAGGKGTRLQSVLKDIPKPMVIINNKPFLEHLLDYMLFQGIKRVILSVGYKVEVIKNYFGYSYKDIEIIYSVENEPLGTGGAIKKALELCNSKNIFVLNGDTLFNVNLEEMLDFHKCQNNDLTIAIKFMKDFDRYGTIEVTENQKITNFNEKAYCQKGYINGGIYVLNKNLLENVKQKKFSFEKDFMEKYFNKLNFYGKLFDEYFIDIGTPEDYKKAKREFCKIFP